MKAVKFALFTYVLVIAACASLALVNDLKSMQPEDLRECCITPPPQQHGLIRAILHDIFSGDAKLACAVNCGDLEAVKGVLGTPIPDGLAFDEPTILQNLFMTCLKPLAPTSTPLFIAVGRNRADIVQEILLCAEQRVGSDLLEKILCDQVDGEGRTILWRAAMGNDDEDSSFITSSFIDVVKVILSVAGRYPSILRQLSVKADENGNGLLHAVSRRGDINVLNVCLKRFVVMTYNIEQTARILIYKKNLAPDVVLRLILPFAGDEYIKISNLLQTPDAEGRTACDLAMAGHTFGHSRCAELLLGLAQCTTPQGCLRVLAEGPTSGDVSCVS